MKHYTDIIPPTLAEKLKEKGMPIILGKRYANICPSSEDDEMPYQVLCSTTYGEVFDWSIDKGVYIEILYGSDNNHNVNYIGRCWGKERVLLTEVFGTWHSAANAAIEKALELI